MDPAMYTYTKLIVAAAVVVVVSTLSSHKFPSIDRAIKLGLTHVEQRISQCSQGIEIGYYICRTTNQ